MPGINHGTFAVIGDSGGIGEAIRNQLLEAGHHVIGVSRKGVSEQRSCYQSLVFDAVAHPCDLSNFADHLDGLVYCPGTSLQVSDRKPASALLAGLNCRCLQVFI